MANKQARVMMIYCPRSTSTVFTKALNTVVGSQIFMDSHSYCWEVEKSLKKMGRSVDDDLSDDDWRKAAEMVVGEDCSGDKVDISKMKFSVLMEALNNPRQDAPLVFCKAVAPFVSGRYNLLPDASSRYRYTFLLRHPFRVFNSLRKIMFDIVSQLPSTVDVQSRVTWEEFHFFHDAPERYKFEGRFFKELYDLWKYVKKNLDPDPVIIDSDDVLNDPAHMMSKYCSALGIPYSDDMMTWDGDPSQADNWWLPFRPCFDFQYFRIAYQDAFCSKGFCKPIKLPTIDEVSFDVRESYEFIKPYYEEMYNQRLMP